MADTVPEQFARTAMLIGAQGVQRLAGARVAVFGIGGVGSYTVEALARSGVGRLLLVDNDTIAASNINRQLHATLQTVGQYKTQVMAQRVHAIHPQAAVQTREEFCLPENVAALLGGEEWDYMVDAVDTISAKLALAGEAQARGVPIISAMGAGNKLDPTCFEVADIFATSVCPLCRVMRRELARRGIPRLKVVYSKEPPRTPLPPPAGEEQPPVRRQTPGSIAFVPAVAGLLLAGEVVRDLLL